MGMTRRTFLGRAVAAIAATAAITQGHVPAALTEAVEEPRVALEANRTYYFQIGERPQPFGERTRWVQLLNDQGQVIAEADPQPVEFGKAEWVHGPGGSSGGYFRSESLNEVVFNTPRSDWGTVGWARVMLSNGRQLVDIPLTRPRPVDQTDNAPAFAAGHLEVTLA